MLVVIFAGIWFWTHSEQPKAIVPEIPFIEPVVEQVVDTHIEDIIKATNEKSKQVNSIVAEAEVQVDGMNVSAELFYKKENNFRMLFYGIVNCNLDIGSNADNFWFWSKQYDKNTLYWAKHEDYNKTRLKTPFNPIWIMESLGYQEVSGDKFKEDEKYIKVYKDVVINLNRKVVKAVMIDKARLSVVGTYIYATDGSLLISSEWITPRKLVIKWTEENQNMTIDFGKWQENAAADNFKMPYKKKKVDMGKM